MSQLPCWLKSVQLRIVHRKGKKGLSLAFAVAQSRGSIMLSSAEQPVPAQPLH